MYGKKTHPDQYLDFNSQHPLDQKLGVVRTLMDRKDNIVTEQNDREEEDQRIKKVLAECNYPKWAMDRVQQQMQSKHHKKKKSTNKMTTLAEGW